MLSIDTVVAHSSNPPDSSEASLTGTKNRFMNQKQHSADMPLYFEDLSVGKTWTVGSHTVTEAEIIEFAEQFDPQRQHIDPRAAEETMFGELVASGLHTLCLSTQLYITSTVDIANMAGLGFDDVRWTKPVKPGDTLSLEIEVLEKTPSSDKQDRGYVDLGRRVHTENDETVLTYVSHVIVELESV